MSTVGSRLYLLQGHGPNVKAQRRQCIRKALDAKCPKLSDERAHGRTTILVLESDDVALGNRAEIFEVTVAELSARSDTPEIVVLARTSTKPWKAWYIKDGDNFPRGREAGPFVLNVSV
jgi:hypothetical protein